jgi:hypothetical protein
VWFVIAAIVVVVYLALYAVWTARRLDRLHARVDAAAAGLQAQLIRRDAAARQFAANVALPASLAESLVAAALATESVAGLGHDREIAETAVTRALTDVVTGSPGSFEAPSPAAAQLHDEALKASFARRFYNDTVRDALTVRDRRVVRWLRLAGHAPHPSYFEMDDEELPLTRISVASGRSLDS